MKTMTIEDIKGILQNRSKEQLECLSYILIPYINNKQFNENASLLRNLSGLSLRQTANKLGISGQSLSQFEKQKKFPADKTKKLFQLYLSIGVDSAYHGNKQLLNAFLSVFFFNTKNFILSSETITLKEELFKKFVNNINNDIYKNVFIDDKNPQIMQMYFFPEKNKDYNDFYSSIDIETEPVLKALTRNLKNIRFILDKDQYEMSNLLGISNTTYSYYENNLSHYLLNTYNACNIINELFYHMETKRPSNENLKKIIKLLFVQKNDNTNTLISETIYDYCIAIKYKQSQKTIEYLENELAKIEVNLEFNIE